MSRTTSNVGASGFSVKHGLPARATAATYSRWNRVGVMFTTASTSGLSMTERQSVPVCSTAPTMRHDALDAGQVGIRRGGDAHEPVVGEEAQRGRVRLRDRAAPDQTEPQRLPGLGAHGVREKLGAASDSPCNASSGSRRSP